MTMRLARGAAWLAAALLLALPHPARAAFEVEEFPAAGGRPAILLARRPGGLATISIVFSAGSVDDGSRSGLTRLTQRAMLESNGKLDWERLVVALYAASGSLSVETGLGQSRFTLTAPSREFGPLAHRLAEAVLSPRFVPGHLPRAVARAQHDGRDPSRGAGLLALVTSVAALDARYRNEPFGDTDQIELYTAAEVAGHLAGPFAPARATVVVTGAFDRDHFLRFLRRFGGGVRTSPARADLALPASARYGSSREVRIAAFPIRIDSPRAAAVARVVAGLAQQELWRSFRRRGTAYALSAEPVCAPWIDLLLVALPTRQAGSDRIGQALREALARVRAGQFDDEAVAREVAAAGAALAAVDASAPALAAALAAGGQRWHGAAVATALRSVDGAAVKAAVPGWLDPARTISVIFSPAPRPEDR